MPQTLQFLDEYLLEDIRNPEHPSDFVPQGEEHCILILRWPEIKNKTVRILSFAFAVSGNKCYYFNRDTQSFEELGSLVELNRFLDEKTDALLKEIKQYFYEIEQLEDGLYDKLDNRFISRWLTYKKELSLIHRLIFDAALSFDLFIRHHRNRSTFEELAYADVHEHMERIRDLAQAALDKLDHLYDFYRARVDERMNRNVYYLTLISGIFLPLTLISGFFGMNTGGLPWADDPNGTWKAVALSAVLEVFIFIPFLLQNLKKAERFKRS
jgi:magnesium transporter